MEIDHLSAIYRAKYRKEQITWEWSMYTGLSYCLVCLLLHILAVFLIESFEFNEYGNKPVVIFYITVFIFGFVLATVKPKIAWITRRTAYALLDALYGVVICGCIVSPCLSFLIIGGILIFTSTKKINFDFVVNFDIVVQIFLYSGLICAGLGALTGLVSGWKKGDPDHCKGFHNEVDS